MIYIFSVRHLTALTKVEKLEQLRELCSYFVCLVLTRPKYTEQSESRSFHKGRHRQSSQTDSTGTCSYCRENATNNGTEKKLQLQFDPIK